MTDLIPTTAPLTGFELDEMKKICADWKSWAEKELSKAYRPDTLRMRELRIDKNNEKIIELVKKQKYDDEFGFLFLGHSGSGKSTLMAALYLRIVDLWANAESFIRLCPASEFQTLKWINAIEMGRVLKDEFDKPRAELMNKMVKVDLLFLDDLGSENTTEWYREQLHYLIDCRIRRRAPTFITSNLTLDEMKLKYHERFMSRLKENCITLELGGDDRRKDIMRTRFEELKARK